MIRSTIIKSVGARTVNRKSDGKEIIIYEIEDADGIKWSTTRRDLAGEANRSVGMAVALECKVEENGIYKNNYLENILPADAALPQQPSQQFPTPQGVGAPQALAPVEAPSATQPLPPSLPEPVRGITEAEKQGMIHRQTAAKVAVHVSRTAQEFWQNCNELVRYFETGTAPNLAMQVAEEPDLPVPEPQNQFIQPEAAPQPTVPPVSDDDIPF